MESMLFSKGLLKQVNERAKVRFDATSFLQRVKPKLCQQMAVPNFMPSSRLQVPTKLLSDQGTTIEVAQKWLTLIGKNGRVHNFPLQTILPKVQMTRHVPPKQLPRDVEVDRRRRQYAKIDIDVELANAGISNDELLPSEEQFYILSEQAFEHFLPLSFFDDADFVTHAPDAWMKLGLIDGIQYPLPAKVFVPHAKSMLHYSWQYGSVSAYNPERDTWTVMAIIDETIYEVSKIQVMFLAENPEVFVRRLKKALSDRNRSEKILKLENVVDCVLMYNLKDADIDSGFQVQKLFNKFGGDTTFVRNLKKEVYLLYSHLMAVYQLEMFAHDEPDEFPNIDCQALRASLPTSHRSDYVHGEYRDIKSLKLDIKGKRYSVLKQTLFYIPAAIEATTNVANECRYIETLSIFVCSFRKPLPLNDFLNSQHQNSNNVATYLKSFWPTKISMGITLVLRSLGKGWLDISLDKWSVYQMCKISKMILQTKLRMQESMQVLLENSIENFSNFLINPCLPFLHLTTSYKWPHDFIVTDFPHEKPIFSIIIGVNEKARVFYSTAPEEFEPALSEIFKKALEKTNGVRYIDAETMINLRFAPNLFILTVELIEDLYVKYAKILKECYNKAIIPLIAYARLYERFIAFYLLDVNEHMKDYENAKKNSVQVKADILEHKRQKQELREILPATIVIGPFLVNVNPMKQYMIKKHIEIVKRTFEYYVKRMYDINEKLMEECQTVYNKINDRPQSIEHLYEIRDFALTVPDLVEKLKGDIQVMWLEYDMLDAFFYNLSDHQFTLKWAVYAWPRKILIRLSTLREEQKIDIEEFKRLHISECLGFEERLESLNEEIQAFSLQFDPERVVETAVDVKKTWKIITDLQKVGDTLSYRQKIFELEELSLEFLNSIIEGFLPYKHLWYACADFLKLEEATVGNPIINIDLEDVKKNLQNIQKSLETSRNVFHEKPEVQAVADIYLGRVQEFHPIYQCIEDVRNPNWLFLHWQELAQRSGLDIKYSITMNFIYLKRKGIEAYFDLVNEISMKADMEADEIRRRMEEEERAKKREIEALLRRKAMRKCRTDIM